MKNYLIVLILVILFGCNKKSTDSAGKETNQTLSYLETIMKKEGIPGVQIVVIKNNEVILSENLGLANVPFEVNVEENTIFPICSISKVFAATAILQLEERDKLVLSDSISKYIPNLPSKWNYVTIEELLSHTSGIPDIEDPNKDELIGGKGQDSAWIAVQKMPLQFKKGEEFSYNATNYLLIQKIIEKVSKIPYLEFLRINQFNIAGMELITYGDSFDVRENKGPTYVYYYQDETTGEYIKGADLMETYEKYPTSLWADAGAFTTADELAKWIVALQTEKLLKQESIAKMWKPIKLNNGQYGGFGEALDGYALGWPVMNRESHSAIVPVGGGRAAFAIYPEDNLAIILLTNLTGIYTHEMVDEISKFYYN